MDINPEIILIQKIKSGDKTAFNLLIKNYKSKLFGYLVKLCGDKTSAEDLMQETLIKAWSGFKKYKEENKFSSWLFTIAHNTALDLLRKNQKLREVLFDEEIGGGDNLFCAAENYETDEIKNIIQKAVAELPAKQKNVFLLRQHGELTFKEISEITKEPINTVLSHMNYAIKKIKKVLREKDAI